MNPQHRVLITAAICCVLALVLASQVANESYGLLGLLSVSILWIFTEWFGKARPEAWLLAIGLFGYIVGNRGFAQTSLLSSSPFFPSELMLLVALPAVSVRLALRKSLPIRKDALNILIFLWIMAGTIRLPSDFGRFGIMALRDYAMVYYAAFFFLTQDLEDHSASAKVLGGAIKWAFAILPVVIIGTYVAPDFFLSTFTFRNIPLIFHKSDLSAVFLTCGFFILWTQWVAKRAAYWLLLGGTSLLLLGTLASPRAAMVACFFVTCAWILSRRLQIALFLAGLVTTAVIMIVAIALFQGRDVRETSAYASYERVVSVFDFQAQGTYIHRDSGDPGDNNRFRLVWWRTVITDTVRKGPVMGLGFG